MSIRDGTDPGTNRAADCHFDPQTYRHSALTHPYADADHYRNPDPHAHCYANANTITHRHAIANPDAVPYPNPLAYRNRHTANCDTANRDTTDPFAHGHRYTSASLPHARRQYAAQPLF